jgi:hypothetical protein
LLPQIDPLYGPKRSSASPRLPDEAEIEVSIHEVALHNGSSLYLVTTLDIDAASAAERYSRRYDVEFEIRDLKVTMDAENLLAQSVVMVKKELMTSVVAYNLIAHPRRPKSTKFMKTQRKANVSTNHEQPESRPPIVSK